MKHFLVPLLQSDQSVIESVTSKKIRKSSTSIGVIDHDVQNNIFDISQNVEKGPNQPNITFPRRNIGGKQRSFNISWYSKYEWLEYSKMRDSLNKIIILLYFLLWLSLWAHPKKYSWIRACLQYNKRDI